MTPVQRAAVDRANEVIAPAMELYEHRCRISYLVGRLSLDDLRRLRHLLDRLTGDDLRQLARAAEDLADWGTPMQESNDATIGHEAQGSGSPGF